MLKTSKLHLQSPLFALGTATKDFENQFGTIKNRKFGDVSNVALLRSRQCCIENDAVGTGAFGKHFNFFDLAAAQVGCRIRLIASGLNEPDGFEIVGTYELGEFFAGIEMSFSANCNRHKKSAGCLSFPRAVKLKFCQLS